MTIAVGAQAIFEHVGGNAVSGKKLRVTGSFVFGQAAVAAARQDEHRRTIAFRRIGGKRGQRRNILRALSECARRITRVEPDRSKNERIRGGIRRGGGR